MSLNQLPDDCFFNQSCQLESKDLPVNGIVNIPILNLRDKPAYSNEQLRQIDIRVSMKKNSSVMIQGIVEKEATINGKKGKWLKLDYIDEKGKKHEGYAWCWNIALIGQ
jgi:hypothetical protein